AGADSAAAAGSGSAVGAGGAPSPFGAAAPSTAMRAITVPTSTVWSTSTRISATTPLTGAGTSVSILSVEMSQIVCSAPIASPTPTRQPTTVPSATDTPIWGMVTSTRVFAPTPPGVRSDSVREEVTARLLHAVDAREHRLLQWRRERDGDVGRRHPYHRAVEILEALLGDEG